MKIILYDGYPPQDNAKSTAEHQVFKFFFILPIRCGGAPSGAAAIIVPGGESGNNSGLITALSLILTVLRSSYPIKGILRNLPYYITRVHCGG